jgi:CRP/FNR family transcriptional regulator
MVLLGRMSAEERVATFLLNLSRRFSARGYSGTCFRLPMTRREIGSYLGLKHETVCRVFSKLNNIQLISINQRAIEINSILKLRQRIAGYETSCSSTGSTKLKICRGSPEPAPGKTVPPEWQGQVQDG